MPRAEIGDFLNRAMLTSRSERLILRVGLILVARVAGI